jgi:hypothetical protein
LSRLVLPFENQPSLYSDVFCSHLGALFTELTHPFDVGLKNSQKLPFGVIFSQKNCKKRQEKSK